MALSIKAKNDLETMLRLQMERQMNLAEEKETRVREASTMYDAPPPRTSPSTASRVVVALMSGSILRSPAARRCT
jgi:hypothetical protein